MRRFEEVPGVLAASDEPVVFNLVEGFWERPEQATWVSNVVRSFGKACTGNDALRPAAVARQVAVQGTAGGGRDSDAPGSDRPPGRPVPTRDLFEGPYIVKPVGTDASEGIDKTSVISEARARPCARPCGAFTTQWARPALIEQFIDGRELNISVIRRKGELEVLPLAEIDFSAFEAGRPRIVGYEAKWLADSFEYHHTPRIIPAPLPKRVTERICELAKDACRALACLEYCRVDFRLDRANRPYVLEVNANPDISPDAGFAAAVEAAGMSYAGLREADNRQCRRQSEVGWVVNRRANPQRRAAVHKHLQRVAHRDTLVSTIRSTDRAVVPG